MEEPIAKADQKAMVEIEQLETAVSIAKDIATTPEQAAERDKLLEEIRILKKQLDETTGERDRFKKERDEANNNLRMNANKETPKSEFDEIFGGSE